MASNSESSGTQLHPSLIALRKTALVAGVAGLAVWAVLFVIMPDAAWASYIFAYLFWFLFGIGGLLWLMIHHLTGGRWGFMIQRLLEAQTRTLPVLALLFLPIFLHMGMYPWVDHDRAHYLDLVLAKEAYLNMPGYLYRWAAYWVIFIGVAFFLNRWSKQQDESGDPALSLKMMRLSGVGLVVCALAITFASVDWTMSLEPEWFSSIYGLWYGVGGGLATMALSVIVLSLQRDREPLKKWFQTDHLHFLGNFMFGFTILWAYVSMSQYLIIWSANLPEEIPYYLNRNSDGLNIITVFLMIFHFALPFVLLLQQKIKRTLSFVVGMAFWLLIMRLVDVFWNIKPAFIQYGYVWSTIWLDAIALVGVGGIWLFAYLWQLDKRPLMVNDPRIFVAFSRDQHDQGEAGHIEPPKPEEVPENA